MDDLFIREDLSRPENRINVAIFGMMNVGVFAAWMKEQLHLPDHAVLYPPVNTANDAGAGRPDFVVRMGRRGEVVAQIEVECAKNEEQIARFRRMFPEQRVIAIWGRRGSGADLSLEDIHDFLGSTTDWPSDQSYIAADHLRRLIDDGLAGARVSPGRASVGEEMWESVFVRGLREVLGSRLTRYQDGQGNMRPRDIWVDTTDTANNRGFSVRVYSPRSRQRNSVSILNRTGGRGEISFSSKAWLSYYLPAAAPAIDELCGLVKSMGADMVQEWRTGLTSDHRPKSPGLTPVRLPVADQYARDVARIVARLAGFPSP